jgi:hypothetical protein
MATAVHIPPLFTFYIYNPIEERVLEGTHQNVRCIGHVDEKRHILGSNNEDSKEPAGNWGCE